MVTKTFCDFCGEKVHVNFKRFVQIDQDTFSDVCSGCISKINKLRR